jgi:hypothetical protein
MPYLLITHTTIPSIPWMGLIINDFPCAQRKEQAFALLKENFRGLPLRITSFYHLLIDKVEAAKRHKV